MACPVQQDTKRRDKLTQYRLACEVRERRQWYTVTIVPVIFRALCAGMKKTKNELTKLLTEQELVLKTANKTEKTVPMDSETLLRKVLSGTVQNETEDNRLFSW